MLEWARSPFVRPASACATLRLFAGILVFSTVIFAAETPDSALEKQFTQTVKPFVTKYCFGCHSGASPAAQFDLKSYTTMDSVVEDFAHWSLLTEKLSTEQMPPKVAPQPPAKERQTIIAWVEALRANEMKKSAGDPGMVLARRLSNAEYNYTIRDLTGVDIRPTKEFPVDPANQSGFDNSGESLSMSPALLNKYLQAARQVAEHMVLTPDGIKFADHPMLVETDRDKFAIEQIVNFYAAQPTDFADYFVAAWRYKHRAELGNAKATLAETADSSKVSSKYLPLVWDILGESADAPKDEVGPIAKLQTMWHALPAPAAGKEPETLREQAVAMRDWVIRIRRDTGMQYAAPKIRGIPEGSQPLLNWKYIQFNTHRRDFDPDSLRSNEDDPPIVPEIPKYPGLHREAAPRWEALTLKSRALDPDLAIPPAERARYENSFRRFASVFPDQFYVQERGRYFPDDSEDKGRLLSAGYHNVMGYWRDDVPLQELILDEDGKKQLDGLWDEFDFIAAHTGRTWDQYYFNQAGEVDGKGAEAGRERPEDKAVDSPDVIFGLRDAYVAKAEASDNPIAVEAVKYHFQWVNDILRRMEKMHQDAEPLHLQALLKFAQRAYRRPLSKAEQDSIVAFYHELRDKGGLNHQEAIRDSIVSVLMSPDFSYRLDLLDTRSAVGGAGSTVAAKPAQAASSNVPKVLPLSGYALADRLSYFLWSSMPDEELLSHAAAGDLQKPEVLLAQVQRMLKDKRSEGLATEFTGNWLGFRQFEVNNTVDRGRFPTFTDDLREAMFEEPVHFVENVIQNNSSILDMLYGNYTFVNPPLAKHYGMPEVAGSDDQWVRVDNARKYERGGLLPMSVFLTVNSPGLRTSPVKRGYWIVHTVLGEVIPPPPPVVPQLPDDESKIELPLREMLVKHRSVEMCAACHAKFDTFGLAFESYGPIGELRTEDLGGHAVDSTAEFPGGIQGKGVEGVQSFIREKRQKEFVATLSRKLLSFALNRSLMLSDQPLLDQMQASLMKNDYRFASLVESVVTSPQFLNRRNPDYEYTKGE